MTHTGPEAPFLHAVRIRPWRIDENAFRDYTDDLPALAGAERIDLDPRVKFLVNENGSGKSTARSVTTKPHRSS
jgi:predicted ATPase